MMRFRRSRVESGALSAPVGELEEADGDSVDGEGNAPLGRRVVRVLAAVVVLSVVFAAGFAVQRWFYLPAAQVSSTITIRERADGDWYVANKYISVDYNTDRMLPRLPKVIVPAPSTCVEALGAVQGLVSAAAEAGPALLSTLPLEQRYVYEQNTLFAQYLCTYQRYVEFFAGIDEFVDIGVSLADIDGQGAVG
jgi:hypothetical protein